MKKGFKKGFFADLSEERRAEIREQIQGIKEDSSMSTKEKKMAVRTILNAARA